MKVYRILLRLFPQHFRDAYGRDMEAMFDEHRKQAGSSVSFWLDVARDTLVHATALHVERFKKRSSARGRRPRLRWDTISRELRFAARSLAASPGFSSLAMATYAVGIGAAVVMASVARTVLFEPLPYPEPDRLVRVFETTPEIPEFALSPGNFYDYRANASSLDALAAFERRDAEISVGGEPRRVHGMRVSAGFFQVLGVEPVMGRGFVSGEETPGEHRVVVISERLWRERFQGAASAVGTSIVVDGEAHTVVGVAPAHLKHVGGSFRSLPFGVTVDVWRPFALGPDPNRYQHFMNGLGRLGDGVSVSQAGAQLNAVAERLERSFPQSNEGWRIRLVPLHEEVIRQARPMVLTLGAGVLVLLLIACVNVSGLLLARGAARRGELAVRSAMGAGRGCLIVQLLTESTLLALGGGGAGLILAWLGVRALPAMAPEGIPRLDAVHLDPFAVAVALAATFVTGLAFGVIPALRLSSVSASSPLRATEGSGDRRLRAAFVVFELSLSIVLLVGAVLLSRTLVNLQSLDPGFVPGGVLTAKLSTPPARYPEGVDQARFFTQLVERLQSVPGVVAAGAGSDLPWNGYDENLGFGAEGRPEDRFGARYHFATQGYFEAIGVPMIYGRPFDVRDDASAPPVAIVNQQLARDVWGDENPVGKRLAFPSEPDEEDWREVVGVIGDVKDAPSDEGAKRAIYMPYAQQQWTRELAIVMRSDREPSALLPALRRELASLDPNLPLSDIAELAAVTERVYAVPRVLSWLSSSFALVALALATLGLYGLISFVVHHERRAIAIRLAMGAATGRVVADVLARSLRLVGIGILLGAGGAVVLGESFSSLLYGVGSNDPWTIVAVALLLSASALVASLGPALRAGRVDPMRTLRHD